MHCGIPRCPRSAQVTSVGYLIKEDLRLKSQRKLVKVLDLRRTPMAPVRPRPLTSSSVNQNSPRAGRRVQRGAIRGSSINDKNVLGSGSCLEGAAATGASTTKTSMFLMWRPVPGLAKTVKNASYTFVVILSAWIKALIRDFKSFSLMFASLQGSASRLNRSEHSSRLIFFP